VTRTIELGLVAWKTLFFNYRGHLFTTSVVKSVPFFPLLDVVTIRQLSCSFHFFV